MNGVQGVHHVAVSVPDLAKAREFYVGLLGASEISETEWPLGTTAINEILGLADSAGKQFIVRLGNTYIEAFEYLAPRSPPQDADRPVNLCGYTHLAIQVEDIDAVYERMIAAGIRFHVPPPQGGPTEADGTKTGMRATYGRDFFGNVFELIEMNRDSAIAPL